MADEVEAVLPQAVVMHPDGYKRVDYALLGIGSGGGMGSMNPVPGPVWAYFRVTR